MHFIARYELAPQGIPVVLIKPGPVATPIWDKSREKSYTAGSETWDAATQVYGSHLKAVRGGVCAVCLERCLQGATSLMHEMTLYTPYRRVADYHSFANSMQVCLASRIRFLKPMWLLNSPGLLHAT